MCVLLAAGCCRLECVVACVCVCGSVCGLKLNIRIFTYAQRHRNIEHTHSRQSRREALNYQRVSPTRRDSATVEFPTRRWCVARRALCAWISRRKYTYTHAHLCCVAYCGANIHTYTSTRWARKSSHISRSGGSSSRENVVRARTPTVEASRGRPVLETLA